MGLERGMLHPFSSFPFEGLVSLTVPAAPVKCSQGLSVETVEHEAHYRDIRPSGIGYPIRRTDCMRQVVRPATRSLSTPHVKPIPSPREHAIVWRLSSPPPPIMICYCSCIRRKGVASRLSSTQSRFRAAGSAQNHEGNMQWSRWMGTLTYTSMTRILDHGYRVFESRWMNR